MPKKKPLATTTKTSNSNNSNEFKKPVLRVLLSRKTHREDDIIITNTFATKNQSKVINFKNKGTENPKLGMIC